MNAILKSKTSEYELSLDAVTLIIARHLEVPPDAVHVTYNMVMVDGINNPRMQVAKLTIVVDELIVEQAKQNAPSTYLVAGVDF